MSAEETIERWSPVLALREDGSIAVNDDYGMLSRSDARYVRYSDFETVEKERDYTNECLGETIANLDEELSESVDETEAAWSESKHGRC